jgi:DNA invertase Pin-like site-specific DNA recombinase
MSHANGATVPVAVASAAPRVPSGRDKLSDEQRLRWSVVYIRQSSPQQVLDHQESTARQYALVDLAVALGWPRERVCVIDEDQGKSASVGGREGFERLLSEVTLGHVGLVLGLELSRLARRSREWGELFELCGVRGTRLGDEDGIYDPNDVNDRLVLGLKGIMSELELHLMRNRLQRGRVHKAQRGELFIAAPIGYVRLPDGRVELDPDEQARAVVRWVFEKFDELGTVRRVLHYLWEREIRLPVRPHTGPQRGQLQWRRPCESTLRSMLRHPLYAGVYSYGRRTRERGPEGMLSTHQLPPDKWGVLLPDKVPAYISREQYEQHQQRLANNAHGPHTPGVPRPGAALLSGLLVCGHCGRRLQVHYTGRHRQTAYYFCERASKLGRADACHGLPARLLDALVTQQVGLALAPAGLEVSLQAAEDIHRERQRLDQHWRRQLERVQYEAARAERQYQAVDAENRLVARTLEQRWEAALREVQTTQEQYARFQAAPPAVPDEQDQAAIRRLAEDMPTLWESAELTAGERSEVIRCLLERVELRVQADTQYVDVTLHWVGGYTSQQELLRPVAHYTQLRDYDRLLEQIRAGRDTGCTAAEIAEHLAAEGARTPRGGRFTADMIRHLWRRCETSPGGREHEWHLPALSRELAVPETRLRDWLRRGWVHGRKSHGAWIAWADTDELKRLRRLSAVQRERGKFQLYESSLTTPKERQET